MLYSVWNYANTITIIVQNYCHLVIPYSDDYHPQQRSIIWKMVEIPRTIMI